MGSAWRERKVVVVTAVFLVVVEVFIYVVCAAMSGREYRVVVEDRDGRVLYETPGRHLTRYEEMSLIHQFGPMDRHVVRVVTRDRPFPFRAWLAASVGVPVGAMLLFAFLLRTYAAVFRRESPHRLFHPEPPERGGWRSLLRRSVRSLSIFHVGFVLLTAMLALWVIPNAVRDAAGVITAFGSAHPFLLGMALAFIAFLAVWIIYLRYRLSREVIRYQFELAKMKIERDMLSEDHDPSPLLEGPPSDPTGEPPRERSDHHGMVS